MEARRHEGISHSSAYRYGGTRITGGPVWGRQEGSGFGNKEVAVVVQDWGGRGNALAEQVWPKKDISGMGCGLCVCAEALAGGRWWYYRYDGGVCLMEAIENFLWKPGVTAKAFCREQMVH